MSTSYEEYKRREEIEKIATKIAKEEAGKRAGGGTALMFMLLIWLLTFKADKNDKEHDRKEADLEARIAKLEKAK